jgi:ApaG protein
VAQPPIRNDIHVAVEVVYAEQHSRPGQHVFVYFITLENRGRETVQLLRREWFIYDSHGQVGHVEGEGVVGEQPVLEPGQIYRYNSFCPIAHPPARCRVFIPSKTCRVSCFVSRYLLLPCACQKPVPAA